MVIENIENGKLDNPEMSQEIEKDISIKMSDELSSVLDFAHTYLAEDLPTLNIDINYFMLAIFMHKKNMLYGFLDEKLMSTALDAISNTFYQVVASKTLSAVKPNRKISMDSQMFDLLKSAESEAINMNSFEVTTNHVFLSILKNDDENNKTRKLFNKAGITYGTFLKYMEGVDNIKEFDSNISSKVTNIPKKEDVKVINMTDLSSDEINRIIESIGGRNPFESDNIMDFIPGNKKNKGKNANIKAYCTNLNDLVKQGKIDPLVKRDKEVNEIIRILGRKKKNNAILLGGEGVGKTAIGESIAYKIVNKEVPEFLTNKVLVSLDMTALMAGTTLRGMFEERVKGILDEIKADPTFILFMDNIGAILADKGKNDYEISAMLSRALENGEVQVIGTSDFTSYRKTFDKDPSLARRFQKIIVEAPSVDESLEILNGLKPSYEKFHNVIYDDDAVTACVKLANKYICERNLPDSAIDVLDETGALKGTIQDPEEFKVCRNEINYLEYCIKRAKEEGTFNDVENYENALKKAIQKFNKIKSEYAKEKEKNPIRVTKDDILGVVSMKTNIPVNNLTSDDKKRLIDMNERIKNGIIGQDKAIDTICKALKRNRVGLHKNGCMYSCMAIGKTGVGKCVSENTIIRVKNKKTNKLEELTIKEFKNLFT